MFLIGIMLFFIFLIAGIVMVAEGEYYPAIFFIAGSMLIATFLAYYYRKQKRKKETAEALEDIASCAGDSVCCLFTFFDCV